MKFTKPFAFLAAVLFSTVVTAQPYKFIGTDSTLATQLCVHTGSNNTSQLKAVMRKNQRL